jgi:hypothetical protein
LKQQNDIKINSGGVVIFNFLGQEPFDMHSAADALEKLSYGIFDDPFADVSWPLPQHNALFAKCPEYFRTSFNLYWVSRVVSLSLSLPGRCHLLVLLLDLGALPRPGCKPEIWMLSRTQFHMMS